MDGTQGLADDVQPILVLGSGQGSRVCGRRGCCPLSSPGCTEVALTGGCVVVSPVQASDVRD